MSATSERPIDMGLGTYALAPEGTNEYDETFEQAWTRHRANHPEVAAVWGQQNGRWPKCVCPRCDPEQRRPRPNILVEGGDD
ncbi:hypothetical protein [Micromonospora sp. NPDC047730]|uniref:hypothetical protein n=1 Tax=Micromonospora sp. NPDC047730 TaxID=3364253 RepID=UPI003712FF82